MEPELTSALPAPHHHPDPALQQAVGASLLEAARGRQPSAWQLCEAAEQRFGTPVLWILRNTLAALLDDSRASAEQRAYFRSLLDGTDLVRAIQGFEPPRKQVEGTIDQLIDRGLAYRGSEAFQGMVAFMARFRRYCPYNNMLVRLQNPACGLYATAWDWQRRFGREPREDARPMLILAPMTPVMLVYALDDTEGEELPGELRDFASCTGPWEPLLLQRLIRNSQERDRILVQAKPLSSVQAGFATTRVRDPQWKLRVAVHDGLDEASRFGTLCHELAHIHLGHLGTDEDCFWPSRRGLDPASMEVEAEAVAYVVCTRLGLDSTSPAYVASHMPDGRLPPGVSLDLIAKVAGLLEKMALAILPPRRVR